MSRSSNRPRGCLLYTPYPTCYRFSPCNQRIFNLSLQQNATYIALADKSGYLHKEDGSFGFFGKQNKKFFFALHDHFLFIFKSHTVSGCGSYFFIAWSVGFCSKRSIVLGALPHKARSREDIMPNSNISWLQFNYNERLYNNFDFKSRGRNNWMV